MNAINTTTDGATVTIGNVVTGNHHGLDLIGRVTGWISCKGGGLWVVALDGEITLYGTVRTEVHVSGYEICKWTMVEAVVAESTNHGSMWTMDAAA